MLTWVVAIVIVVAIVAAIAIARWQRKSHHKNLRLELTNRGNVQGRYELKAEDPDGALEFQFSLAGGGLTVGTIAQETAVEVSEVAEAVQPERPSAKPGTPGAKQAQVKARQAVGFSGAIAALAFGVTIGNIESIRLPIFKTPLSSEPVGLTQTDADLPLLIPNCNDCVEAESASTLDHLGNAIDVYHPVNKLLFFLLGLIPNVMPAPNGRGGTMGEG